MESVKDELWQDILNLYFREYGECAQQPNETLSTVRRLGRTTYEVLLKNVTGELARYTVKKRTTRKKRI